MPKQRALITNFRALPYNPVLKERAREMRNNSIKGEIKFWCELLRKKERNRISILQTENNPLLYSRLFVQN